MKTITSVEAQNRFGALLDNAQREPIAITRRGRPVAVILSPRDMEELTSGPERRAQASAEFKALFAEIDARLTDAAKAPTDEDIRRLVDESR
jgi:antitoxin Phd